MNLQKTEDVRSAWQAAHLSPLWESPNAHKPPAPPETSVLWQWSRIRLLLELAFQETSPAAVERRVLQLISPHSSSMADEFTAGNVLAAVQCLLPGESARPHRHSMNALRFVLEGRGAETIVDGKPCFMEPGDLILTPAWCWHEHRHQGDVPVLWLDVLDVPLHAYLGTARFQPPPVMDMPVTMSDSAFATPNLLPDEIVAEREHSPVFRYPYGDVVKALSGIPAGADGIRRVRYVNPMTGGPAMALLDSYMMQIDPGQDSVPTRTNANAVCAVVEGHGTSKIGDETVSWGPNDIFTLPQWNWISHRASECARVLVISDRDVLRRLGLHVDEVQSAPSRDGGRG